MDYKVKQFSNYWITHKFIEIDFVIVTGTCEDFSNWNVCWVLFRMAFRMARSKGQLLIIFPLRKICPLFIYNYYMLGACSQVLLFGDDREIFANEVNLLLQPLHCLVILTTQVHTFSHSTWNLYMGGGSLSFPRHPKSLFFIQGGFLWATWKRPFASPDSFKVLGHDNVKKCILSKHNQL